MIYQVSLVSAVCTPEDEAEALKSYCQVYVLKPGFIEVLKKLTFGRIVRSEGHFPSLPPKVQKAISEWTPPPDLSAGFYPEGKPSIQLLNQAANFFRLVMDHYQQNFEAHCFILWSPEQGYHIFVPDQLVEEAYVRFEYEKIPSGSCIVVDLHSHNTMGAFFSGTDDANDKKGINFSGVIGSIRPDSFSKVFRFTNEGIFEEKIPVEQVFDLSLADAEDLPVPEEWLEQVDVRDKVARVPSGTMGRVWPPFSGNNTTYPGYGVFGGEYMDHWAKASSRYALTRAQDSIEQLQRGKHWSALKEIITDAFQALPLEEQGEFIVSVDGGEGV